MKIAKLASGEILQFPDQTEDKVIDCVVATFFEKMSNEIKKKEKRDSQLVNSIGELYKINHANNQLLKNLIALTKENVSILKEISIPKKRKIIKDSDGKLVGSEEY